MRAILIIICSDVNDINNMYVSHIESIKDDFKLALNGLNCNN